MVYCSMYDVYIDFNNVTEGPKYELKIPKMLFDSIQFTNTTLFLQYQTINELRHEKTNNTISE